MSETKTLLWPPDKDIVMNVAGFEEALESSVHLRGAGTRTTRTRQISSYFSRTLQMRAIWFGSTARNCFYLRPRNSIWIWRGPSCSAETLRGSVKKRPCVKSRRFLRAGNDCGERGVLLPAGGSLG